MISYFLLIFLAVYLPFEPFINKFIPDRWYLVWVNLPEILIFLTLSAVLYEFFFLKTPEERERIFKSKERKKVIIVFIIFCAWGVASALINWQSLVTATVGLRQIFRFSALIPVVYLDNLNKQHAKKIINVIMGVVILQALLGLSQVILPSQLSAFFAGREDRIAISFNAPVFEPNWLLGARATGTLARYDRLGIFLSLGLILLLVFRRFNLFVIAFVALLFTYSRTAWLGTCGAIIYFLVELKKFNFLKILGLLFAAMIISIFIYSFSLPYPVRFIQESYRQNIAQRILQTFSRSEMELSEERFGRIYFWKESLGKVIKDNFIFGVGPGRYGGGATSILDNKSVYDKYSIPFGIENKSGQIDNNWLSLWGELGTGGLIIFILLLCVLWGLSQSIFKNLNDDFSQDLSLTARCFIVAYSVFALFGPYFEIKAPAFFFWVVASLLLINYEEQS